MKFVLMIMARGPCGTGAGLGAMARAAEAGGLDFLAFNDHVVVPRSISSKYPYSNDGEWPGAAVGDCLEMATVASFLAATTDNIGLLTSVMVVPHRPVVLAAKMLATVDVLSGGRLTIGVGAGWMREEFESLGLPPFQERGIVTDEYIQGFKALWTEENPSLSGRYVRFDGLVFEPKPVQKPHPPIWVAAFGPKALRQAGSLGFPYLASPMEPIDQLRGNYEKHRLACNEAGVQIPAEVPIMRTVFVSENARLVSAIRGRLEEEVRLSLIHI